MTSSSSSSSSRPAAGLVAALALGACGAVRPAPAPPPLPRLVLFPVQNLTGGAAPAREVTAALRERLAGKGIELVPDEEVTRVLAARRIRYTGGLDRATAAALRDEVGAEGVVLAALEAWVPAEPFRIALTARLASVDAEPEIRWLDAVAASGRDAPGLLGLGVVPSLEALRDRALDQLSGSLAGALRQPGPVPPCPQWSGRAPDRSYPTSLVAYPDRESIAVLPFVNDTRRRDAGEVVALRMLAPLVASGTLRVVEPGVARQAMLAYRLGASGALSLDDARTLLELLQADLVLSGTVRSFEDAAGSQGAPTVDLSVWVLDRLTGHLAWSSTTSASGDDGASWFGLGRVTTASALTCAVAKGALGAMLEERRPGRRDPAAPRPRRRRVPRRWSGASGNRRRRRLLDPVPATAAGLARAAGASV